MQFVRRSLFAASLALAVGGATAASATSVLIQSAGIYEPGTVSVVGPGINSNAYATALELVVTQGGMSTPTTLYAFCVDLFHNINVGLDNSHDIVTGAGDAQAAENLAYHTAPLTLDSSGALSGQDGVSLSATQVAQIEGLADLGRGLIVHDVADLADKLAGVQAAIWQIEYPSAGGYSVTASGVVDSYMAAYLTTAQGFASGGTSPDQAIYADNGSSQGFVVGVPEPATWALMIVGVGLVGLVTRRRARAPAAA